MGCVDNKGKYRKSSNLSFKMGCGLCYFVVIKISIGPVNEIWNFSTFFCIVKGQFGWKLLNSYCPHTKQHSLITLQYIFKFIAGISFVLPMIISVSPTVLQWVTILPSFTILSLLPLTSWTILSNVLLLCMLWIHLCNNDCWVLFCCHQTEFTHKYICIYTKNPHFVYLLKNVHYSCFISYI